MTSSTPSDSDRQLGLAMQLHQQGKLGEAQRLYEALLAQAPNHPEALHRLGLLHHQSGQGQQAVDLIRRAIALAPESAAYHSNLGLALRGLKEPRQAVAAFEEAIRLKPDFAGAYFNLALALQETGEPDRAIGAYGQALSLRPDLAEAHVRIGDILTAQGKAEEAKAQYRRAASLKPHLPGLQAKLGRAPAAAPQPARAAGFKPAAVSFSVNTRLPAFGAGWSLPRQTAPAPAPVPVQATVPPAPQAPTAFDALLQAGNTHFVQKRYADALHAYAEALSLEPKSVNANFNRANTLLQLGRVQEALQGFEATLQLAPDLALAHYQLGVIHQQASRNDLALNHYRESVRFDPRFAQAHFNAGTVLEKLNQLEEALVCFQLAGKANPQLLEAFVNQANIQLKLHRLLDAIDNYQRVLALQPDHADALSNIGSAQMQMKQLPLALDTFSSALHLRPHDASLYAKRALVHVHMKRLDLAQADFDHALQLDPTVELLQGNVLASRMLTCQWADLIERQAQIRQLVRAQGRNCILPFNALGLFDEPELHLAVAQLHARQHPVQPLDQPFQAPTGSKIKVAYISADLQNHATTVLMAELFELHDKGAFETIAISIGPDANDEMRKRLLAAFDRFVDARQMTDAAVARLCRELGVDIAVDLKGFTEDARFGIFAHRCAPIQVSYIGYPGTTGADCMDYVLADPVVLPFDQQPHYTERIVHLPHSYQVNDSQRRISSRVFTRTELGLPEDAFVFCCFNNNYKIHPATYDVWMRLLRATPGSVLWLFEDNAFVGPNLRREAEARGVSGDRLVFAPRMPLDEHLARHRLADLFLDTLPYNAHTTTSDALWAGLPVVTLKGQAFAGRVAASLLTAVGLPELITDTPEAYEALALALAHDRERLQAIRHRLAELRTTQPLFNARLFARHLEAAYRTMVERQRAGLPPQAFAVPV